MTGPTEPTWTAWRPDQLQDFENFLVAATSLDCATPIEDFDADAPLAPHPDCSPEDFAPLADLSELTTEHAMDETGTTESKTDKANGTSGTDHPHDNTEDAHKRPSLRSMFDIVSDPDAQLSWQADGLVPHGGIVLFVGGKSAGKSTLARQYALCVARGEPFLGREVEQGAVVIASLENPRGVSSEHWHQLGLTADDPIYGWDGVLPGDPTAWLNAVYEDVKPGLIVIDSFGRWTRGKASMNSYDEIIGITEPVIAFSRRTQTAIAFTHHVRKGGGDDVSETVSGSMALIGTMDTTLHLLRDGNGGRTIQTTQRAGADIETTALQFDNGRIDLGGIIWKEKAKATEAKVLAMLPINGDPLPNSIIHKRIRGNKQTVTRVLHKLVDDGITETVGNGTRKHPLGYRLRLDPSGSNLTLDALV